MADPLVLEISVFVLAVLIGQLVLNPRLRAVHRPLIALSVAISSASFVAALAAAGAPSSGIASAFGFIALVLSVAAGVGGVLLAARLIGGLRRPGR